MLASILGWVLSTLSSPALNKVFDALAKRVDADNTRRLEELRALSTEGADLVRFNETKLTYPWFWWLITLFVAPLGIWWAAVIADSIFHFPFDVANLPTPEMKTWAGDMIRWLFYVGTVSAAVKAVFK